MIKKQEKKKTISRKGAKSAPRTGKRRGQEEKH